MDTKIAFGQKFKQTVHFFVLLGLSLGSTLADAQVVYTYNDTVNLAIPEAGTGTGSCAAASSIVRTINVPDTFTVVDAALGIDISHEDRGQIQVRIDPPGGVGITTVLPLDNADTNENYRVMLSSNAEGAADDGDDDTAGATVRYRRLVTMSNAAALTGATSNGNWVIRICDRNTAGNAGTLNSIRLVLRSAETFTAACSVGNTLSYEWGSNGDAVAFVSAAVPGLTISQGATSGEAVNDAAGGIPSFVTRQGTQGNHFGYYRLMMDTSGETESSIETSTITFSEAVHGLTFDLLDVDIIDGSWEDYVRIEGFGPLGEQRSVQVGLANAQLQYAGDWVEADATVATTSTDGNVTYNFSGPVSQINIQYAQGDSPASDSVFQIIGASDLVFCAFDFGDAPASYNTLFAATGARHTMSYRTLFMGTTPDGDADGAPSAAADGDGADEDGLTLPTEVFMPSAHWECGSYSTVDGEFCVSVNVTNNLASSAQLVGWIDLNGDGDFADANERSIPRLGGGTGGAADATFTTGNVAANSSGSRVLVWTGLTGNETTSATFIRLRLTTDSSFFSDASPQPNGSVTDGEVEDHLIPAETLPVTLSFIESAVSGDKLSVRFSTATETNNVGFSVEEKLANGEWMKLHQGLIASQVNNAAEPTQYGAKIVSLPQSGQFFLVDHDIYGRRKAHGPYLVGATRGREISASSFSWNNTRNAIDSIQSNASAKKQRTAKLWVSKSGFHRVSGAEMIAAGVNINGMTAESLSITYRGRGVPHRVSPATGAFNSDSYIDFMVQADTNLYTNELPYLLRNDGVGKIKISTDQSLANSESDAWYWAESVYAPEKAYNFSSPTKDPWYAEKLLAYPNQAANFATSLAITNLAETSDFYPELRADLIGVTNWSGVAPDHQVRLEVGGQTVVEESFDGIAAKQIKTLLPLTSNGLIDVNVVVTGQTGFDFDLNYLDGLRLRYPRLPVASDNRLFIDALQSGFSRPDAWQTDDENYNDRITYSNFEGDGDVAGFRVDGLTSGPVVAYVGRGDDWRWLAQTNGNNGDVVLPSETGSSYWVSSTMALHQARIETVNENLAIASGQADYIIISHPLFLSSLQPLIDLQESRGLDVKVVDVQQIYAQYADHVPEAQAIQRYLDHANTSIGAQYVLLVGADTYDYKNFLGTNSVSLIPTQYTPSGEIIRYAPADALYADSNRDGAPEFAIGRLPVRSITELEAIQAKLAAVSGNVNQRNLVLVAARSDAGGDFDDINDDLAARLPSAWNSIARAYIDQIGVGPAQGALQAALSANPTMISFVGHSAPSQWSFDPLLTANDIANSSGAVADLVVQWGCWNSYFVSPTANTMAHAFLLSPNKGAAAVIGVSSLSELRSHRALGELLYPELQTGVRIGDAFRLAKMQLAAQNLDYSDILITATLLGDPAMPVR